MHHIGCDSSVNVVSDAKRFADAGRFARYCRCVKSLRQSNGKQKGENNRKCGNKYLAWAFVEAAHFACRYDNQSRRFYDRKKLQTNPVIATGELGGATIVSLLALSVPFVALGLVILFCWLAVRTIRRLLRRSKRRCTAGTNRDAASVPACPKRKPGCACVTRSRGASRLTWVMPGRAHSGEPRT